MLQEAPDKTTKLCIGCKDNFYNGNNPYGVNVCWSFAKAIVEKRIKVSINERPPYNLDRANWTLSCHQPQGYVQVKPDALTKEGFWK